MPERPFPWAAVLPALALFAFWRVLAQVTPRPAESAEATFLALPVALVALTAGLLAGRRLPVALCILALAAAALLPGSGGARAVLTGVLCALTLALALLARRSAELPLAAWIALAMGLQALCEPALLLAPRLDAETLLRLLLLPAAAAWAGHRLAAARGTPAAGVAGGSALAFEGGIGPLTCLGLLVAILVDELPVWRRRRLRRPAIALTLAVAGAMAAVGGGADWGAAAGGAALLALALPAAPAASWTRFLLAAALAAGAVRLFGAHGASLLPSALLLALGPLGGDRSRQLQLAWSGALALGSAGLAFYPWLRDDPVPVLRDLVLPAFDGPLLAWAGALLVIAAAAVLARLRSPGRAAAVLLFAVALAAAPHAATLLPEPVLLGAERRAWSLELPTGVPLSSLTVDSFLAGAASLPVGAEVGSLEVVLADGTARRRRLLVGRDTVDRDAPEPAAVPWLAEVSPTARSFGRSGRLRWEFPDPAPVRSLTLRMGDGLPAGGRLVLLWVGGAP